MVLVSWVSSPQPVIPTVALFRNDTSIPNPVSEYYSFIMPGEFNLSVQLDVPD